MRSYLDRMSGWIWIGLFLLAAVLLGLLVQVLRYLVKRVLLWIKLTGDHCRGKIRLHPRRPLWWLLGRRCAYDLLLDLTAPATGETTHTLAVKLIPTIRRGTEYSIGDLDRWHAKTNFLLPTPRGVMKFDFGYRKCLPRPVDSVFRRAPAGVIRVYLFHPPPHALTLAHRGENKHNPYRGVTELGVPLWREGVLCLDLDTLRKLERADAQVWETVLTPPKE